MDNIPEDYLNPDFENRSKVHDWKNYASERLEVYWDIFSAAQKAAIAECLQNIADFEHWE